MFNFITIIKPAILPSIRVVRSGLLFCEPELIRLIWLGYKLHLLLAEFIAGNTTVRNELVYVLDALLRLKQLTTQRCTWDINNASSDPA